MRPLVSMAGALLVGGLLACLYSAVLAGGIF